MEEEKTKKGLMQRIFPGVLFLAIMASIITLFPPYRWDNEGFRRETILEGNPILASALPKEKNAFIFGSQIDEINIATTYSTYKVFDGQKKPFEDKYVTGAWRRTDTVGNRIISYMEYNVVKPIVVRCERDLMYNKWLMSYLFSFMGAAVVQLVFNFVRKKVLKGEKEETGEDEEKK